ncbi:hypothetical protein C7M84_002950 [Penaeus vannamei]|uniref:Uncharacterized protein n=1 Tax=Penaeus vannamei TaxID=6689 RepID=A0A423TPE4_PENVA|nr:hypothetical protein C7M84_002950 [Penaeus vannamei]
MAVRFSRVWRAFLLLLECGFSPFSRNFPPQTKCKVLPWDVAGEGERKRLLSKEFSPRGKGISLGVYCLSEHGGAGFSVVVFLGIIAFSLLNSSSAHKNDADYERYVVHNGDTEVVDDLSSIPLVRLIRDAADIDGPEIEDKINDMDTEEEPASESRSSFIFAIIASSREQRNLQTEVLKGKAVPLSAATRSEWDLVHSRSRVKAKKEEDEATLKAKHGRWKQVLGDREEGVLWR